MATAHATLRPPHATPRPLDWTHTPEQALAAWPSRRPLVALVSGARDRAPRARWSILASPTHTVRHQLDPRDPLSALTHLRETLRSTRMPQDPPRGNLPFIGGWIGFLSYELNTAIEPTAARPRTADPDRWRRWPVFELHRCPGAYLHDRATGRWFAVGEIDALPPALSETAGGSRFEVGRAVSNLGRAAYRRAVARAIEYIRAGDVFQVNVAHQLVAPFRGSPRAMFGAMLDAATPWYGAYLETDAGPGDAPRAVCSMSPELFLEFDPATRRVVTRPIKGTRRADAPPHELITSQKDAAELVMIVDLMRNDLGRVCRVGSIRVSDPRTIEHHGGGASGVQHGVATIEGTLRDGLGPEDLIGAAFPPGSITGAPKVRAMQIIDELEPDPRGPYCGAIGSFSDCGRTLLNVAIRTASITGEPLAPDGRTTGEVRYGVGAGIVADSDPDSEWHETIHKAIGFLSAVDSPIDTF